MEPDREFVSRQRIHFDMVDLMGVVHNGAYLNLFERARTDWIQSHGWWYGSPEYDWPYYVVRNEVNYHAPLSGGEEIQVTVQVSRLGRTSATFAHRVYSQSGALAADGQTILVRIDPETRQPIPWSERFRALVAPIRTE